jgi:hypothetical protein
MGQRPENVTYAPISGKSVAMMNIQAANIRPNLRTAPSDLAEENRTK